MNRFMKWWNRDKIKERQINERLDALASKFETVHTELFETKQELDETLEELEETKSELEVYRKQEEADEAKRNGNDPWVEIKGDKIDPIKGIQIELDWNDAFIQYLKDNGLSAKDDDALVQKWLAMLYVNLLEDFEQQIIENSDIIGPSEFE